MSKIILAGAGLAALLSCAAAMAQPGPQGPVTRDQYLAQQKERFTGMDANGDGTVTKEEASAAMTKRMADAPQQMIDRMFQRMDTNGDGKATAAEAEAAAAARFTALDTDKNGTLTPEEQAAGMRGMRRQ